MNLVRQVFGAAQRDPFTWAAVAVSVGLAALTLWWFPFGPVGVLATLALTLLTWVGWLYCFGRFGRFQAALAANRRARALELRAEGARRIDRLDARFEELAYAPGRAQLALLGEKFDSVSEVIRERLDVGEIAHSRYLQAAEQVYLSALDNLSEVDLALRSVTTVSPQEMRAQIDALRAEGAGQAAEEVEKRLELHKAQWERAGKLMAQNERAMTALLETATRFAETQTKRGAARVSADRAIEDLERLAEASKALQIDHPRG